MTVLRFTAVDIQRFLGIGRTVGPVLLKDMAPGLNVVWAPNGRGKSCTAQAMVDLLWHTGTDTRLPEATAELVVQDDVLRRDLGCGGALPGLPAAETGPLYCMSLPELLESGDSGLADRIRQELHGNVDLGQAERDLGFRLDTPKARTSGHEAWLEAADRLKGVLAEQQEVSEREAQLVDLQRQEEALTATLSLAGVYSVLRDRAGARDDLNAAEAELKLFPGMAGLTEEDAAEFSRLLKALADTEERRNGYGESLQDQLATRARAGFGEQAPPTASWCQQARSLVEGLESAAGSRRTHAEELAQKKADHEAAQKELHEAEAAFASCCAPFSVEPTPDQLKPLTDALAAWKDAREGLQGVAGDLADANRQIALAQEQASAVLSREPLEAWLASGAPIPGLPGLFQVTADGEAAKRLQKEWQGQVDGCNTALAKGEAAARQAEEAVPLLKQWLRQASTGPSRLEGSLGPAITAVALLAGTIGLLAWLVSWFCLSGLLVPAALAVWLAASRNPAGPSPADAAKQAFLDSDLEPPAAWTPREVGACLARHLQQQASHMALQQRHEYMKAMAAGAAQALAQATEKQRALAEELQRTLGLSPQSWDAAGLEQLCRVLAELRALDTKRQGLAAKEAALGATRDRYKGEVTEHLQAFFDDPADSFAGASAQLAQLQGAATRLTRLRLIKESAQARAAQEEGAAGKAQALACDSSEEYDRLLATLQKQLAGWHPDPAALDAFETIAPVAGALADAADAHREAARAIERLRGEIEQAEGQLRDQVEHIDGWLARRELPVGRDRWSESRAELAQRLSRLEEYRTWSEKQTRAALMIETADAKLSALTVPEGAAFLSRQELEERLADMERLETEREDCRKEIHRIETERDGLRRGRRLEDALAAQDQALSALARRRDEAAALSLGKVLVDALSTRAGDGASAAFDHAKTLLQTFTRGRCQLKLSAGAEGGLTAVDGDRSPQELPLEKLSSGTRVQLLIAARLGFLMAQEETLKPPFILDEALAVSDPKRTAAIMAVVAELVRSGRQVIYFTAQPEEVEDWRSHFAAATPAVFQVHENLAPLPAPPARPVPAWHPAAIPKPEAGEDLSAYGSRLPVPLLQAWDPDGHERGAAGAHLWYVAKTPPQLHAMLRLVGERCGQLEAFLAPLSQADAARQLGCPEPDLKTAVSRIRILDRCLQLYRQGRPVPVPEDALAAGLVDLGGFGSGTRQEIEKLRRQCRGEAEALLEAVPSLRGVGKGGKRFESLRTWLEENGHLGTGHSHNGEDVLRLLRQEFGDTAEVERVVVRSGLFQ